LKSKKRKTRNLINLTTLTSQIKVTSPKSLPRNLRIAVALLVMMKIPKKKLRQRQLN